MLVMLNTDLVQVNILPTWKHTHALISSIVKGSGSDKGGPIITPASRPLGITGFYPVSRPGLRLEG